jgi:heat shock protein HtpX
LAKTKFPVDRGLTARMLTTVFLLGLFYAILVAALAIFVKSLAIVIIIPLGLMFAQYYASDKIALWSMHAKIVTEEQAPQLHAVIDRLCALADMPKPRVAIADADMPNAFATGRNQSHAVVCVTTGILRRLNEQELGAVLAHELSHVAHRDVAVMTIASFLGILAGFITRMLLWSDMFGGIGGGRGGRGGGRGNQGGGQLILIEFAALAFSALFYLISFMLIRALSRYRELAADRSGAILIGQPRLLATALQKVTGDIGNIPTRDLRTAQNFNAFFFAPAFTKGKSGASVSSLFATHPPLEVRLEQLAKLEAQMSSASRAG